MKMKERMGWIEWVFAYCTLSLYWKLLCIMCLLFFVCTKNQKLKWTLSGYVIFVGFHCNFLNVSNVWLALSIDV